MRRIRLPVKILVLGHGMGSVRVREKRSCPLGVIRDPIVRKAISKHFGQSKSRTKSSSCSQNDRLRKFPIRLGTKCRSIPQVNQFPEISNAKFSTSNRLGNRIPWQIPYDGLYERPTKRCIGLPSQLPCVPVMAIAWENTPLLSDSKISVYERFSKSKKKAIVFLVSWSGLLPCM